ncbi:MAG TPA: hypothetical protein IGS53_12755 [Leptolyngbyaceae cyanobacterium M33_DOE_097]|uniref:Uncharacterized protein n=1 Tax=Oscillatoriales cyanobacterium SpSt-418 TaxID=2282169 RepID=A0A7C3KFL0_9CYAN|nr:hypothetical protein [Leptolyngbyaceae cyanobacterium M33_DOE_097]
MAFAFSALIFLGVFIGAVQATVVIVAIDAIKEMAAQWMEFQKIEFVPQFDVEFETAGKEGVPTRRKGAGTRAVEDEPIEQETARWGFPVGEF